MGVERLVDGAMGPAFAIDSCGRVVAANAAVGELLGAHARDLVGQRCSDISGAADAAGERLCQPEGCSTLALLASGRPTDLPWCSWIHPDGTHLPISATALALPLEARSDSTAAVILLHVGPGPLDRRPAGLRAGERAIRISLFDNPACTVDGAPVQLPRRRALEVLALLAFAPAAGLHKEQMCDALWAELPGGSERMHLRVLLHSLRRSLASEVIIKTPQNPDRLQLAPRIQVDVLEFTQGVSALRASLLSPTTSVAERLERVDALLALYVGDLDDAGVFGAWVAPHRERLRSHYIELLREATRLAAEAREPDRAMAYCRRAVAADPLHEEFQIALIAAYGQLGLRRAALTQYQSYRKALTADLALEPSMAVERALGLALRAS